MHEKTRKRNVGAKPTDVVLMFELSVVKHLYNLSAALVGYEVRDWLSFMRFLGLQLEDRVPEAETVWLFREGLKELGLVEPLFARFRLQLAAIDGRCHVCRDVAVHGSQAFDELLDHRSGPDGKKREAHADSAYRSQDQKRQLAEEGIESQIFEKDTHAVTPIPRSRCNQTGANPRFVHGSSASLGTQAVMGTSRAHHWVEAGTGEDRDHELGVQHEAFGVTTQA